MSLPALLVHPPLGLFEGQLMNTYDVVHWPTDRKDVRAAVRAKHGIELEWEIKRLGRPA